MKEWSQLAKPAGTRAAWHIDSFVLSFLTITKDMRPGASDHLELAVGLKENELILYVVVFAC